MAPEMKKTRYKLEHLYLISWKFYHKMSLKENSPKIGLSAPSKKLFYLLQGKPFKMMKNAFYFILKARYVLKIFKFLS